MKVITTLLFIFITSLSYTQDTLHFEVLRYDFLGETPNIERRNVPHSGKLTLDFYRNHFLIMTSLPEEIFSTSHKYDTIIKWNEPRDPENEDSNYFYKTIYDDESRVIRYRYSSCIVCSSLPFDYEFIYDKRGRLTMISNRINDKKTYQFEYDRKGNLIQVKTHSIPGVGREITLKDKLD